MLSFNVARQLKWTCVLWLFLISKEASQCAEILGIFPIVSKSHYSIARTLMNTLALKGHRVTVMSGFEENGTDLSVNYSNIYIREGLLYAVDSHGVETKTMSSTWDVIRFVHEWEANACHAILSHEHIREQIAMSANHNRKTYDLIIADMYYIPCYLSLAVHLNVPIIWLAAYSCHFSIDYFTGNQHHPAIVPSATSGLSKDMTFIEVLVNFYQYLIYYMTQTFVFDRKSVDIFNNLYETNITVEQIYRKPNLALYYGHYSLIPRSNIPNVVEIGGLHIQKEKKLPQDIKDFIEDAKHGVVYFSFGSTLRCSSISGDVLTILKTVFSIIPQRVIWRCDIPAPIQLPNLLVGYWFPQVDILAHTNVRVFISHGGMLGTYEAIYTATPIIGIPFLLDQHTNIAILEKWQAAVHLDYDHLTVGSLLQSINSIINDFKYSENMEKLSTAFKDRPMSPLNTAVYWTEYVIRHKGAVHLSSSVAVSEMALYQYLLLDTIFAVVVMLILTTFTIFKCAKLLAQYYVIK